MLIKGKLLRQVNRVLGQENLKMCSETNKVFPATTQFFYTRENGTILQPHSKLARRAEKNFV